MEFSKILHVIDSHTMGEPNRTIIKGLPEIYGETIARKKEYMEKNLDHIRRTTMHEPRGHRDMFGSIILPPTSSQADYGIIFMDGGGYLNMCGHGTIGAASILVETQMVDVVEPFTNIVLESPAGLIKARVKVEDGKAKEVSIINVASFLYKKDMEVELSSIGKIKFDIAFGGSFFAIIEDRELGLEINLKNIDRISKKAIELRDIINRQIRVEHPIQDHIKTVDLVEVYGRASSQEADYKNVVIFGAGQVDRSPCGTGTSAKMASLYAKGKLGVNEDFIYESIINTRFKGRILEETKIGKYKGIIPEITGSAYITGFNQLVIDEEDPVKYGFCLS